MLPLLCLLYTLCLVSGRETATNYCAQISSSEANLAVGYFAMQIYAGKASYTYSLDISKFTIGTCDLRNGTMYHIHTSWNTTKNSAAGPDKCGSKVTALHYDPNLACGYTADACTKLGRTSASYNCTPAVYGAGLYSQCQVGDLSGKFGTVKPVNGIMQQLTPLMDYQPPYAANYLVGTALSQFFSSVVFHCPVGGTKLICAKLQLVPAGQSSICPFPQTSYDYEAGLSSDLETSKAVVKKTEIAIIILAVAVFCLFVIIGVLTAIMYRNKRPNEELAVEIKA